MALTLHRLAEDHGLRSAGLEAHGIVEGDRVALLAANSSGFLDALLAVVRIDAVAVPLNTRLSATEVDWLIGDAAERVVLVDEHVDEQVRDSSPPVV